MCRIPDDCIDSKRYPLFMAREVMRQLIDNLCVTSAVHPGDVSSAALKTEDSQAFFIDGLGQKTTIDAAQACGGAAKVAGVAVEETGLEVLLSVVTLGIYTPRTARVYCK
jgi:hypothetical protein